MREINDEGRGMIAKLEARLDNEFEAMDVKVYIYHIRDVKMFAGITIATEFYQGMAALSQMIEGLDFKCKIDSMLTDHRIGAPATWMRKELAKRGFYGIALCDRRDQFSRKRGRIIAKGRLQGRLRRQEEQDYKQEVYAQIEHENKEPEED